MMQILTPKHNHVCYLVKSQTHIIQYRLITFAYEYTHCSHHFYAYGRRYLDNP